MRALKGYMLTILGPDEPEEEKEETYDNEVEGILTGRVLSDAEDVINDHLPDGYQAKFSEAALVRGQ